MGSSRPSLLFLFLACCQAAPATGELRSELGLSWPATQAFPSFAPIGDLDVIDRASRPADELTLLVTLQGLVNRTQPRIYVLDGGEGKRFWLDQLGVGTTDVADAFALVAKYRSEIAGLVVYDPAQLDTVNLATTIAGLQDGVVASPALAERLTAPPHGLPVLVDLRSNHFTSKLAVYQYELDHYAAAASHRLIIGLNPGIAGNLRDYAVATRAMTVWLDPRQAAEQQLLSRFLALLPPNSPYLGWWADEPSGVRAASSFGVPVYAADFSCNLTVLGGAPRGSAQVPPAPPRPRLQSKVYAAIFMSDGDNLQEDQHLIPIKWADANRGRVPIGWTINPALVDVAPSLLRYYQTTATANDVLVSGPSGLGYTYPAAWPNGRFEDYARLTGAYLGAAGLRVITVWNNGVDLSEANAQSYVANAPDLLGLTIQDASQAQRMIGRVPLVRFAQSYAGSAADLQTGIDRALGGWSGSAPLFVAVQGNMNSANIHPSAFYSVQQRYAGNASVSFVRPDHFFSLLRKASLPRQHRLLGGDFNGDGKADALLHDAGDDSWWMGLSTGDHIDWRVAGNTRGFGYLLDASHQTWTGDFNGDGKTDVLLYHSGDGNWWLGASTGETLAWSLAGNTSGFGNLIDAASHQVYTGDFNGDGKTDVLFYYNGDGNLWLGLSDGRALTWQVAGNARGFGNLLDGRHRVFTGDFNGDGKTDLYFYFSGDGSWWAGLSSGTALAWRQAGNVQGFGNLLDAAQRQLLPGDFNGDGKSDVAFYNRGDGRIWLGLSDGNALAWRVGASASGFGNLLDPSRRIVTGDFNGDGKTDVAFYYSGDGTWWVGASDGNALTWHSAGSVPGFGNLLDPSRMLLVGDYTGDRRTDVLFYYSGDSNWWLGASDGNLLGWRLAGTTSSFDDLTR